MMGLPSLYLEVLGYEVDGLCVVLASAFSLSLVIVDMF